MAVGLARVTINTPRRRVDVALPEQVPVAELVPEALRVRGHEPVPHGALVPDERSDWAWACSRAARDVVEGRADQAIVCCWTGTGASITSVEVEEPNLEAVFLHLTGKALRD